jgi:hypothetical protein
VLEVYYTDYLRFTNMTFTTWLRSLKQTIRLDRRAATCRQAPGYEACSRPA